MLFKETVVELCECHMAGFPLDASFLPAGFDKCQNGSTENCHFSQQKNPELLN